FEPTSSFRAGALLSASGNKKDAFEAKYKNQLKSEQSALDVFKAVKGKDFIISDVSKKEGKRSPAPPFTTSSLQQQAAGKLGFSVSKTMRTAQRLYESGLITYMRTDSFNLSNFALNAAKEQIETEYGEKYYNKRVFKTKTKGAQEAHEAIRPTNISRKSGGNSYDEKRLYELIRKRTLASQMSQAVFEKTKVIINADGTEHSFDAVGEVLVFDGFLKAYYSNQSDIAKNSDFLPPLKKNQKLKFIHAEAREVFTKHPARYTEAALVKKMEELGIGRPSTYAPTISTLQNRSYVLIEDRPGSERKFRYIELDKEIKQSVKKETYGTEKSKMFPTDTAMVVTDFLVEHFKSILDYNFTAKAEEDFDEIAEGKTVWYKMIDEFYSDFNSRVQKTIKEAEKNTGERILGEHPDSGKRVSVRLGKFGPVVQLGAPDDEKKPSYVSLQKDQFLETITFEEALTLLKSSGNGRYLGTDEETGEKVFARVARYGPIVQRGEGNGDEKPKYVSLLKGMDVETLSMDDALALLSLPKDLGQFEDKKVVTAIGRFGPYVRHDGKFASLKKTDSPLTIDLSRAIELIKEKKEKDRKRQIKLFPEDDTIKIIKDRWGRPCIYSKRKYYNISDVKDPEKLTLKQCKEIIEKQPKKKTTKKKTKKKTAAKKKNTKKKNTKKKPSKKKSSSSKTKKKK
ncbi:MAG: DNA topoisomerase, partial [Bacteroidota bacterium]|nr:DNA topoisomerase [Bacteroidota bacterium]